RRKNEQTIGIGTMAHRTCRRCLTFTIALHDKRAWEMLMEDRDRCHSIGHGWATDNPSDWEDTTEPVLSRLFVKGRSGFATKVVRMSDPPLCSAAGRRSKWR